MFGKWHLGVGESVCPRYLWSEFNDNKDSNGKKTKFNHSSCICYTTKQGKIPTHANFTTFDINQIAPK